MKQVAKLVIIDEADKYPLMYRAAHPIFGDDPDLPGGTLEEGESPSETMIREIYEQASITIAKSKVQKVYEGTDYSMCETYYSLYIVKLNRRPDVAMS